MYACIHLLKRWHTLQLQMAREDLQSQPPANALLQPAQALRNELQNSVEKLKDSNQQLKEAIQDGDKDPELRTSIGVSSSLSSHTEERLC